MNEKTDTGIPASPLLLLLSTLPSLKSPVSPTALDSYQSSSFLCLLFSLIIFFFLASICHWEEVEREKAASPSWMPRPIEGTSPCSVTMTIQPRPSGNRQRSPGLRSRPHAPVPGVPPSPGSLCQVRRQVRVDLPIATSSPFSAKE